jgi:amidophosphoribosyltransferase
VFWQRENENGIEYIVTSENVALDVLDFQMVRDTVPAEVVLFDLDGRIHSRQCAGHPSPSPCIFEFVYLARPDSIIDEVSIHKARLRMGKHLAERILRFWPKRDIDVVKSLYLH